MLEGHPHDYDRHDTTSLFAAMNVTEGTVIARTHRRHRDVKLKKFMQKHDCDKLLHPQALTRDLLHRSASIRRRSFVGADFRISVMGRSAIPRVGVG
ncbi:hypothetical protein [Propioniciclava flava]